MAASDKFTPYFGPIYSLMRVLLGQTGEQELLLRARAMECVGLMNLAVGRAHCEPVLAECTELALGGLELALPELKEYTYGFFAQTAELVGADIGGLLPRLLPQASSPRPRPDLAPISRDLPSPRLGGARGS